MPFVNIEVQWDIVRRRVEFCLKGNYVLKWTCFACFLVLNVLPGQLNVILTVTIAKHIYP